jgi:hypothetical protein
MTAPAADLKTNEILRELRERFISTGTYADRNDIAVARIARDISAVARINPNEGFALRAQLASCLGDCEATEEAYVNCVRIPHEDPDLLNIAAAFERLGMFSRAQRIVETLVSATSGNLSLYRDKCYPLGLFQKIATEYQSAENMGLEFSHGAQNRQGIKAARILADTGISDRMVAEQLDVLGTVLRRHRLIHRQTSFGVLETVGNLQAVVFQIMIDTSPRPLLAMNLEAVHTAQERQLPVHESLGIMFGKAINA